MSRVSAYDNKIGKLEKKMKKSMSSDECLMSKLDNMIDSNSCKSSETLPCTFCDGMLENNDNLHFSHACMKSKYEIKKSMLLCHVLFMFI